MSCNGYIVNCVSCMCRFSSRQSSVYGRSYRSRSSIVIILSTSTLLEGNFFLVCFVLILRERRVCEVAGAGQSCVASAIKFERRASSWRSLIASHAGHSKSSAHSLIPGLLCLQFEHTPFGIAGNTYGYAIGRRASHTWLPERWSVKPDLPDCLKIATVTVPVAITS